MAAFLVRYVLVAVLGSFAVWQGVPALRQRLEQRLDGTEFEAPALPEVSSFLRNLSVPKPFQRAPDPGNASASRNAASSPLPDALLQGALAHPDPAPLEFSDAMRETLASVAPNADGTDYDWGVLAETVSSYTTAGAVAGKLPGGTVIEKISVHESSRGPMARCRMLQGQRWLDDVFIPESAIILFAGPYAAAPPEERSEVVRFLELRARIDDRRSELKEKAIRANPHFTAYQKAARALVALQTESKALIEQRDAATGQARSRLDDQLRRMKFRAATLEREFENAGVLYKQWRSGHDDGSQAASEDALLRRWTREYAELEPTMRDRIQGL